MYKSGFSFSKSLKVFNDTTIRVNPLLLLLFLPGLTMMRRGLKRLFSCILAWCFILGVVLSPAILQIELDRFMVIFYYLVSLPAAIVFDVFLGRKDLYAHRAFASVLLSFLLAGILSTANITGNRSIDRFAVVGAEFREVLIFLNEHSDDSGRLIFSGSCLHDFNSGHLAPLPLFVDHPMIASSHLHNLWQYTQVFPEIVMKGGDKARSEYLDLLNVTMVAAHEPSWQDYFLSRPKTVSYTHLTLPTKA